MPGIEVEQRGVRGGASIAVAMAVMNIATYGYTLLASRVLGPEQYGGFAAVMNTLIVISVLALALQAAGARRISAGGVHVGELERVVLRVSWVVALGAGVLLLVLSPVLERALRLDGIATALLVAATAVPLTFMGGQAGVLQGERRWHALGAVYLAAGVPRLLVGTALLLWRPSETLAVLAVAIGAIAPVIVGWWTLRSERPPAGEAPLLRGRSIGAEATLHAQALLAYFALSNLDIVVARNVLGTLESGYYAGGLILTKAMLFLPQFVVVVAFPSLSTDHERRWALTRGLSAIALLGALGTVACAVLPQLALLFIGGNQYAPIIDQLWLFALLGTLLAMLQLLVYDALAQRARRSTLLVWLGLVVMLVVAATAESLLGLVLRVIAIDTVVLLTLMTLSLSGLDRATGQRTARPA